MFEPAVLQHRPHLLMHHHILQIFQRWMVTHLLLKWEHVLMYRPWASQQNNIKAIPKSFLMKPMKFVRDDYTSLFVLLHKHHKTYNMDFSIMELAPTKSNTLEKCCCTMSVLNKILKYPCCCELRKWSQYISLHKSTMGIPVIDTANCQIVQLSATFVDVPIPYFGTFPFIKWLQKPLCHDSPSTAVQRDNSSQSTRPKAYISILKNASLWKFMAPSSTSGAM